MASRAFARGHLAAQLAAFHCGNKTGRWLNIRGNVHYSNATATGTDVLREFEDGRFDADAFTLGQFFVLYSFVDEPTATCWPLSD